MARIEKIIFGMSIEEVKTILNSKPFQEITSGWNRPEEGKTKLLYSKENSSLEIYFFEGRYIAHKIIPNYRDVIRGKEIEIFVGNIKLKDKDKEEMEKKLENWN